VPKIDSSGLATGGAHPDGRPEPAPPAVPETGQPHAEDDALATDATPAGGEPAAGESTSAETEGSAPEPAKTARAPRTAPPPAPKKAAGG
jgi:hypothetical protein